MRNLSYCWTESHKENLDINKKNTESSLQFVERNSKWDELKNKMRNWMNLIVKNYTTYKLREKKLQTENYFVANVTTKILIFNIYWNNTKLHRKMAKKISNTKKLKPKESYYQSYYV